MRRRVHDIGTWLEAWTMYMHATFTIAPHHVSELLSYQAMILAANRQYYLDAWLSYDQQLRMLIVSQPGRRFDSIDINTWQLCVTSKARPRCSSCNIVHPASTNCPFVPNIRIKAHHQGCSPATAPANLSAATSISAKAATRTAALPTPATAVAKTTLVSNAQPTRNDRHSCANLVNIQCSYNSPPTSVHNSLHDSRSHPPLSLIH